MNGRIEHMHHHYRVVGQHKPTQRIRHLAETQLGGVLNRGLDQAFAGDEQVIILRELNVRFPLILQAHQSDADLLEQWADKLVAGIARMAHQEQDAQQAVRFESEAHFLGYFLHDLLRDRAWEKWVYFPLIAYKDQPKSTAVSMILQENKDCLPQLLSILHRWDDLDAILNVLDDDSTRKLWQTAVLQNEVQPPTSGWRPIFSAALQLLTLFQQSPPDRQTALFEQFVSTQTMPPDWQDKRGLATAVFNTLRYLQGQLNYNQSTVDQPTIEAQADSLDAQKLTNLMHHLDWLDHEWLTQQVRQLHNESVAMRAASKQAQSEKIAVQPYREHPAGTKGNILNGDHSHDSEQIVSDPTKPELPLPPRAKRLLAVLVSVLTPNRLDQLNTHHPTDHRNSLRLFAWVQEENAADNAASSYDSNLLLATLIEQLLICWAWLSSLPISPQTIGEQLENGRFHQLPTGPDTYRARQGSQFLKMSGNLGSQLILRLLDGSREHPPKIDNQKLTTSDLHFVEQFPSAEGANFMSTKRIWSNPAWTGTIDTQCAGIFLLIRAIMDSRLPWLASRAQYPKKSGEIQFDKLLLMLGRLWAGLDGTASNDLDDGLLFFSGGETAVSNAELNEFWHQISENQHRAFTDHLLSTLSGQRLVDNGSCFLHKLDWCNGHSAYVFGSSGQPSLWPLVAEVEHDEIDTIKDLLERWCRETGQSVTAIVSHQLWPEISAVQWQSGTEAYQTNRTALTQALNGFGMGETLGELVLATTGISIVKLWARWLRQFSSSSAPYLLDNFIRRPGQISVSPQEIKVVMAARSLDVVTEMAGYFEAINRISWLGDRALKFEVGY